jgi:hypothetical protein
MMQVDTQTFICILLTRRKLQQCPLELSRPRRDVFKRLPVVLAHLEKLANLHPGEDPEAVAEEDVEDEIVPPALVKVGQKVAERHLKENWHFKHKTV